MTSNKVGKLHSNNEVNIQIFISCKCTTYLGYAGLINQVDKCSLFFESLCTIGVISS